jgi:hypothetical protein
MSKPDFNQSLWSMGTGVQKEMERDCARHANINDTRNSKERSGGDSSLLLRSSPDGIAKTTTSEFVLQWGNRKRLRCMKIQVKDDSSGVPVTRTTVRVDRRVVKDSSNHPSTTNNSNGNQTNAYLNLRQRPLSPQQPPPQRVLRLPTCSSLPFAFIYLLLRDLCGVWTSRSA